MGFCFMCRKKSIFLKTNEYGRCKQCEIIYQQQQIALEKRKKEDALAYYNQLSKRVALLREELELPHDPIEKLSYIPTIENRISESNSVCSEIQQARPNEYFEQLLIENSDYNTANKSFFQKVHFKSFNIKIYVYSSDNSITEKFHEALVNEIQAMERIWKNRIFQIKQGAKFEQLLRDIPSVETKITSDNYDKLSVACMEESIKYSKITSKTNYSRIGNFVVIDVETTGLSSLKNELIEICAIKFEDWTPVEKFNSLIKPNKSIPEDITEITGISNEMVENAPTFSDLISHLNEFIGKNNIVGYNLPFDLKFIYRNGFDFTNQKRKYYDVLEIAKNILKKPHMKWDKELSSYEINYDYDYDVEDYKLTTVCEYFSIRDNSFAHRAASDALATGLVFMKLAQEKIVEL